MHLDHYVLKAGQNLLAFEFISEGTKGRIIKRIQFSPTNYKGLYNLAFGDVRSKTGKFDDLVVSDNGDIYRVLATVVAAVYIFTDKYADCWVYAKGSSKARTRLYRMGISRYLSAVKTDFDVFGQIDGGWEEFAKDIEYEAFIIRRKMANFNL